MPCFIGIKRSCLRGLLWLYLYGFGFMALSLEPGFLDFDNLPDTNFSCVGKVIGGYYADLETNCQMFHVCTIGQLDEPMDIKFLCLNGTVFDQETRVCERIDEVDCTKSEQFYSLNLELYGHSQSSNLEEIAETEQPLIIKSTPITTTTTPPPRKTTRTPYYTSLSPPTATTPRTNRHHISTHHFPILNPSASDIRFNPEEINISLHPGAPPDIRTKGPISYYSDKKVTNSNDNSDRHLVVNTHSAVYAHEGSERSGPSTQKSQVAYRYNSATSGDASGYGFTYRQDDSGEYTDPPETYRIRPEFKPSQEYTAELRNPLPQHYKSSTYRSDYATNTQNINKNYQQKSSTTIRNYFVHSLKPPAPNQAYQYEEIRTESPQRVQLPLPLLPTLHSLTFSSPAPFSLQQRKEQKRYTKDHIPPPRIVISASASVSDASGRKLNYSLGTIRSAQLSKPPPNTYDEYKDEDVALDPFYLDVPKVKGTRKKRSTPEDSDRSEEGRKINYSDIIRNDEEALHVLKFLFDWYKSEKTNPARYTTPLTTPLDNEGISSINHGLAPESSNIEETEDDSLNFKFDINGGEDGVTSSHNVETKTNKVTEKYTTEHVFDKEKDDELFEHEEDYVNDNYEPLMYREPENKEEEEEKYWDNKEDVLHIEENQNYDDTIQKSNKNNIGFNVRNHYKEPFSMKEYDNENDEYSIKKDKEINLKKSNFENIFNINDHIHNKKVTKENSEDETTNQYSSQVANEESALIVTTEHPEEQTNTNEQFTTLSTFEIENTLTTDRKIPIVTKPRSTRRGTRKFTDINKTDKAVLVEKFIEKPHRAKDDYDFLRTIHNQTPTPKTNYQNTGTEDIIPTTEIEFIPTITENPIVTSSSIQPVTLKTIVEVITTIKHYDENLDTSTLITAPITSTQKPRNKSRRGKFKFTDFSSEEAVYRRKKPENKNRSSKYQDTSNQQSREIFVVNDSQERYSEILESTTKDDKKEKQGFTNNKEDIKSTLFPLTISPTTTPAPTLIFVESTTKEDTPTTIPAPTVAFFNTDKIDADTIPVQNSYIDVYATSFVPTTETIHITKKKQLKENLLDVNFDTTTESVTETTEETPDTTTWSAQVLNKLIHKIESDTNSIAAPKVHKKLINEASTTESITIISTLQNSTENKSSVAASKVHKKLTTEAITNTASTTESITIISTLQNSMQNKSSGFNISGLNLVSVSVEENGNNFNTVFDSTTESIILTTDVSELNESIGFQTLDFKKEMNDFIGKLDNLKIENKRVKNVNSIEADTKNSKEDISDTTTLNLETTTVLNENTPITTTFDQTAVQTTTLEETSTETTQPTTIEQTTMVRARNKGGKPTRRSNTHQKSSYRHRFSTDSFTKRPKARKQIIEEEIIDVFRKSKDLTTESYRSSSGKKEYVLTDYPERKSVNPTQAERTIVTTPFSNRLPTKRHFFFNCFGKEIDKFYPDLRDCRLFHYCTQGYNKNQLLDMKFVCDFNTYFDDENLICTKTKPKRCL